MSFGFVITSSVAIAGVFLVFSYLVIPSVGAMLISDRLSTRLAFGWIGGSVISFVGVKLSWDTGLPTSPLIVVLFAVALIGSGVFRYLRLAPDRLRALRNMAGSFAVVALFIGGLFFFKKAEEDPLEHTMHMLNSPLSTDRQTALMNLESYGEKKQLWLPVALPALHDKDAEVRKKALDLFVHLQEQSALPGIVDLLNDPSDEVQQTAIQAIKALGNAETASALISTAEREEDPELKTSLLKTALELGNPNAIPPMIKMLKDGGVFADEAYDALRGHVPVEFKKAEAEKVADWWLKNKDRLHWDEKTKMFALES